MRVRLRLRVEVRSVLLLLLLLLLRLCWLMVELSVVEGLSSRSGYGQHLMCRGSVRSGSQVAHIRKSRSNSQDTTLSNGCMYFFFSLVGMPGGQPEISSMGNRRRQVNHHGMGRGRQGVTLCGPSVVGWPQPWSFSKWRGGQGDKGESREQGTGVNDDPGSLQVI